MVNDLFHNILKKIFGACFHCGDALLPSLKDDKCVISTPNGDEVSHVRCLEEFMNRNDLSSTELY